MWLIFTVDQVVHVGLGPCQPERRWIGLWAIARNASPAIDLFRRQKLDPESGAASSTSVRKRLTSIPSLHPANGGHWRLQRRSPAGAIALDVPRVDRRDRALNHSRSPATSPTPTLLGEAFGGSTGPR